MLSIRRRTAPEASSSRPRLPQATMMAAPRSRASETMCRLSGPSGSGADRRMSGFDVLKAKRLTTSMPPQPQDRAKAEQRRMVGSSVSAVAVLGLSMTNVTAGRLLSQRRQRRYLYLPAASNAAPEAVCTGPCRPPWSATQRSLRGFPQTFRETNSIVYTWLNRGHGRRSGEATASACGAADRLERQRRGRHSV